MVDIHIILGAPKEEAIAPLIQTEGIIIGVDRGAFFAIEEKLKLDVALGDFDSIAHFEKDRIVESGAEIYNFPTDKDDTDAELAFSYVLKHYDAQNIYVYNWYGGRVDHLHSLLMLVLQNRFRALIPKLKFVSSKNFIEYFLPGEHIVHKLEEMNYLSYILLTKVASLTLKEVKYELTAKDFSTPLALISNEFLNDKAILAFDEGIVAAIQSRD